MDVSRRSRFGLLLFFVVPLLSIDQTTKLWAFSAMALGQSIALPGPFDLTLVFNRSNAFGLAPDLGEVTRWGLAGINLAVAGVLGFLVCSRDEPRTMATGLVFIIAGGIGNAIDRIWLGAVIDMLDATETGFIWVFNAADVFINVGIGLVLLDMLVLSRAGERRHKASSSSLAP